MTQQMGYMDDTFIYEDADMERLYSHNDADVGDNETQGSDDPQSGTGATQGEQSKDPATRVLRDRELRTIKYAGRIRQVGPNILSVQGSIHTYYTSSQSQSQNTSDSTVSHMAERIKELEAERDQQRAQIKELTNQMAIEKSENEAYFRRLEDLFLHGSSSPSVPDVAQCRAHPEGGTY
ncbi:hypothetical protein FH972_012875 [Carpinus fangiana]|uniref:Uncharacterized protein n=1 Tax=Carpinus fangiana TaxID=176857 RepID=A0A5N6R8G7_9ROSI|nr:hypothetical protein FH972_012875 [Carpinus fangiana]